MVYNGVWSVHELAVIVAIASDAIATPITASDIFFLFMIITSFQFHFSSIMLGVVSSLSVILFSIFIKISYRVEMQP